MKYEIPPFNIIGRKLIVNVSFRTNNAEEQTSSVRYIANYIELPKCLVFQVLTVRVVSGKKFDSSLVNFLKRNQKRGYRHDAVNNTKMGPPRVEFS